MAHYCDLEAERSLLGSLLLDNSLLARMDGLQAGHFLNGAHAAIYRACEALAREGRPLDPLTVGEALAASGGLQEAGGLPYISSLVDKVFTVSNASYYKDLIISAFQGRTLRRGLVELVGRLDGGERALDLAPDVAQAASMATGRGQEVAGLTSAFDALAKFQEGRTPGFTYTGFPSLDAMAPGTDELVVVGARPSIGKTSLAVAVAERIAARGGPVLFLSAEMSGEAIHLRRVAAEAGVPMSTLRQQGALSEGQWKRVGDAFQALSGRPFHVLAGGFSLADLLVRIRVEAMDKGLRAVFFDHLGKLQLPRAERHDIALGMATEALARLAKDLGVTVFVLSQLSRDSQKAQGKEGRPRSPTLSDLRDSGRIEQDADVVWLLDRDSYYLDTQDQGFQVDVAKNRNGPTGRVRLIFDEKTGRFSDPIGADEVS